METVLTELGKGLVSEANPLVFGVYLRNVEHNPELAARSFERCASDLDCKNRAWAYAGWGSSLIDLDRADEGIEKVRSALALDPTLGVAYNAWGRALWLQSDQSGATRQFQQAISADPKCADCYYNLGVALLERDPPLAIREFQKAIEIDGEFPYPYIGWGRVLGRQNDLKGAIDKFKKATELDPQCADAYLNWGAALSKQGSPEALQKIDRAIQLRPSDGSQYMYRGCLLHLAGKESDARVAFDRARKLHFTPATSENEFCVSLAPGRS